MDYTNLIDICQAHLPVLRTSNSFARSDTGAVIDSESHRVARAKQASCRERSGSVVECLTRDRRVAGSSLTGVTALWSLSKTHLS